MAGMILAFLSSPMAHAEEIKKLAKEVQNPVSDLVRGGLPMGRFSEQVPMTIF